MSGGKNERSSKTAAARPHAWAAAASTSTPRAHRVRLFAAESQKSKDIQQNS